MAQTRIDAETRTEFGKGAARQAVQCANLMSGLPETTGLSVFGVAP